LNLGHKRYQEKHKEKVAVDSIKESITSATNRMTKDLEEDFQKVNELFNNKDTDSSSSDEDEDDEVPDERESRHKDIPNRREWSPAKNKLINMLAKGKEDSQKDGTDKRRQKYEERLVLKSKFIDQLSELEETQAGFNSALEQLELDEDPEGDNDILDLTAHLSKIGPDLLEGSYATRVELMRTLTNKSGAIIQKKSRRLQGLGPEIRDLLKIKNPRERRHLMLEADIEKGNVSPNPKEKEGNREEYGDK
jgi:chemotaxis protein histidine kinase CheA